MPTKDDEDAKQPARGKAKVPAGTAEIGMRSPDSDSDAPDHRFRRSFTLTHAELVDVEDQIHAANQAVICREAINNGLSPKGTATFDGADDVAGFPALVVLRYSVAVEDGLSSED